MAWAGLALAATDVGDCRYCPSITPARDRLRGAADPAGGDPAEEQPVEVLRPRAVTQVGLMSIYRTLRLRGHDPLQTIAAALRTYLQTGQLPPLPSATVADG